MKKELQSNVNGMTSGGGSIQHPFSIHSASIGSRWKLHGLQSLMITILLLFTMAIGQMWGADFSATDISTSGTTKNHVTCTSTAGSASNKQGCTEDGGSYVSNVTASVISGSANSNPNSHYIEIKAASGYKLVSPITIDGVVENNADKTICVVYWEGDYSGSTFSKWENVTFPNRKTACASASTNITFTGTVRTIRLYKQLYINNDGYQTSSGSGKTQGGNTNLDVTNISASAVEIGGGGDQCSSPSFSTQPTSADYAVGASATDLTATATATNPGTITYKWQKSTDYGSNYSDITGATNQTYSPSTETAGITYYRSVATFSGGCSDTNSDAAIVAVSGGNSGTMSGSDYICFKNKTANNTATSATTNNSTALTSLSGQLTGDGSGDKTAKVVASTGQTYSFTVASGYTFAPTYIGFKGSYVGGGSAPQQMTFTYALKNSSSETLCSGTYVQATKANNAPLDTIYKGSINISTLEAGTYTLVITGSQDKSVADNFRLGNWVTIKGTVAEAVPSSCTTLDAPTGLSCTGHTSASLTFEWTAAENASSYDVKLWDNSACTGEPVASENVTTTSKTFTGLTDETTYYCKVQSKGDGETYCTNGGTTAAASGITDALPSYTVTAVTSTGNNDRGTVSAAASSVKMGGTTTITAVPAAGYRVSAWAATGTGASISPDGLSHSTTATLTVGTSDVTVTVTFEEIPCPTSGVVYTMTMKSKSLSGVTQYTEVGLVEGDYATETGGVAYLGNNNSTASKAQIKTEAGGIVYFDGNDAYIKIALECPLQPGDLITIEGNASSSEYKYILTKTNSRGTAVTSTNTAGTKKYYTVVADDILDDESVVYIWREVSGGNKNVHSVTITRPYTISFASAKGSAPSSTTGFEVELEQITGVSGWVHTGWTADKVVKVSEADVAIGTAMAVDATATVSANTTFTAVWEEEVPTFSVTYKANNGTEEADVEHATESAFAANMFTAPEGKLFNGWNTKAEGDGTPYAVGAAVTAATTVYAQWIVDPTIRLILKSGDTYSINTEKFEVYTGTELDGTAYTVQGTAFAKNFKFGNTGSAIAGQAWANKFMAYDVTTNSTDIKLYLYNKNSGTKNLYYQIIYEGAAAGELQTVEVTSKGDGQILNIPTISAANGARVVFCVSSTDVRICQMEVRENGTTLPTFGTNGYQVSIPGRPATYSNNGTFDGFTIKSYGEVKFISGISYLALRGIDASSYVTFTTASNIQLQVTTANANKFYVCAANIGTSSDKQYGGEAGTHNVNLIAGTYYIVPTAGSSGGEVQITKLAFATAPATVTVTFNSNEGSAVAAQELFSGDKAVEPTAPTKSGYRFVEWQLSGSAYDFDDAVTTDIELDAVWQKTWTVTFNSNGGSDVDAAVVDNGATVAAPDPAPTKGGYDFVEWRKEGENVAYDFATAVNANITLVAQWEVAQDDASLSALSYNSNAIDVNSAVEVAGVQTYTYHLQYGSSIDPALISVTKNAESANMSVIAYDSENKQATFMVTSGNGLVSINYAIQFVIDPKRGTSIIKATTNNVVTGLIGGTIDQSYSGNANSRKLNKGNYFGVTLANDETFQEGDVFIVNITTPADLGKFMIYADKNRTELVADQGIVYTKPNVENPVICPTGEMMLVLPAAANGKKSLYLSRENVDNSEQWNVTFSYIEVTREMNPAIKSFKFGDDAATINEGAKTITIEMPYSTDVTALTPTVEAYGNNGATYTPSGAQDFTSPVNYVVTDAYSEFSTTYAVTVTKAAASTNADLASLAVAGYSLDFDPATTSYNIVLDYGTTVLPAITYEVAEVGLATAEKVEGSVNSATTITVTPEAGAGYEKVYTINFSVSTNPEYVIYDGSTMTNIASATGADGSTGFSYSMASNIPLSGDAISSSWGGKDYTHAIKGFKPNDNSSNIVSFVIPEGYVAKVRLVGSTNSDTKERKLFIAMSASKDAADALDNYIITSSTYDAQGFVTDYLLPNTYYLGSTDSYRLFEFSIQLYPIDYSRNVTEGRFGTICLPNGGVLLGADLYEVAYYGETSKKIFFDEILSGVMEAGVPYVFLPQEGVNKLAVVYTDDADAAATNRNGLVGFIGADEDDETSVPAGMYILQNNQYREVLAGADARIKSYRAYINLGAITPTAPALAPGRRRISMGVASENSATGMDELNASETPVKMMIDGQLYILRGEKLYDATGRLVK